MISLSQGKLDVPVLDAALIALGLLGILQPSTSALLHNTSTFVISAKSTKNLLTNE